MGTKKSDKIKSDLYEKDKNKQDDALEKWIKEKKKSEKNKTSLFSEVVGGIIDIITGV